MEKHVIIYFRDGRNDKYPIDVLSFIVGDRDVVDVIDADTGVVIYSAADGYIDHDYDAYINAPMPDLMEMFRSAVNI